MRRKIILSIGVTQDAAAIPISDEDLKRAVSESRWCKGTALVNGNKLEVMRARTLGGYTYKIGEQTLNEVDAFLPNEFMDWRDG